MLRGADGSGSARVSRAGFGVPPKSVAPPSPTLSRRPRIARRDAQAQKAGVMVLVYGSDEG
jgi:hypothetical protein